MFIELKCKTNFSFLRGASSARELVVQAQAQGMKALGIADVNGVYALPRVFEAIRDLNPEMKLISGAELTMGDHSPITLLAQSRAGYGMLCRLLTHLHAGKEKGEGFLNLSEMAYLLENFSGGQDLVCLPEVSENLQLGVLKELFGRNLYLPLCRYLDGMDRPRTQKVLQLAREYDLSVVATNDVHYHIPQRRSLQDCLTCIREGVSLDQAGFHLFGNQERYLKSEQEMQQIFSDLPEALANTVKIAESCQFQLSQLKYTYPQEFIPEGHTAQSYLRQVVYEGALETYKGSIPEGAKKQIETELAFFAKRGDEHYFLTVHDIVAFAKRKNILCQGRGSAANSIVCYVLGVTSVDPIQMNLLFDRFMNDGRQEPPDIDVDFEHNRREEVIQYIYERFGRERAAMVAAVRTYRSKSAFLELSKACGVEMGTISAGALQDRFDELAKEKRDRRYFVEELVSEMKGFPRHLSIHSGGFVLSNDPLIEIVPIEPARKEGRTIIQWDKDDLETVGLMKVDVLSIGFLAALHTATDLAGISWREIPDGDKDTYAMIQRAETHGTFQIESRAQMNMLVQTLPQNYYDLVVEVALVRPSPSEGGMVQPYIRGLKNARLGKPFKIGNKILENILGRTHGVPIFQEQIMQISVELAGFTPAEADQLRRSLVRQRGAKTVNEMGDKLYKALIDQKIPKDFADALFRYIQGYAHYGFPESHAASYASLAYKSAYMKCHHPAELICGLINAQPMGFYPIDTLIHEAQRKGVRFLPIHPNYSDWGAKMSGAKTVRMGFCHIRGIQKDDVLEMIEERKKKHFESMEDFISRTNFSREVLENLANADVFVDFGLDRRHSYWKSLETVNLLKKKKSQQLSMFDENLRLQSSGDLFDEMNMIESITMDHRTTGFSLQGNLMKALRFELPWLPPLHSEAIKKQPKGRQVEFAGIFTVLQRPPPAKGTAFITFEDEFGSVDTVVKSEVYEKYRDVIRGTRYLIVSGTIQKKGTGTTVLVSHMESFSGGKPQRPIQNGPNPRDLPPMEFSFRTNANKP